MTPNDGPLSGHDTERLGEEIADAANEEMLLGWAETCTGAELEKVVAKYRRVLRVEGFLPVDALFYDTFGSLVPGYDVRSTLHEDATQTLRADLADGGIDIDADTAQPWSAGAVDNVRVSISA